MIGGWYVPRTHTVFPRPRRLVGASGRTLNFTVRLTLAILSH